MESLNEQKRRNHSNSIDEGSIRPTTWECASWRSHYAGASINFQLSLENLRNAQSPSPGEGFDL
jgi:hypothetical protein